jgi:hypothetical protein
MTKIKLKKNKNIDTFKTLTSLVRLSHAMQPPYSMTILLGLYILSPQHSHVSQILYSK